ncbi:MAG TPA: DUF1800 domain-containing protein [Gemmatales bacterium]|nr:DUF1800 domain-containing protein [Gemmatales bacterium]
MLRTTRLDLDPAWAWQPYRPSAATPWDLRKAGHLLRRAGFGATRAELDEAGAAGPEATIERLLQGGPGGAEFDELAEQMASHIAQTNADEPMRAWWLYLMLHSPHPLREKMTLFWHNHFATSQAKVNNVDYMLQQNALFRRQALGDFRVLLQEVSKDPAMLVWLDTVESKKGRPNENYARELMELFSLGIGHYTEHDIREAARAFTGWELRRDRFHFNTREHDRSVKQVFGRSGPFTGEEVVRLCLEQQAAPLFLVRKLCRCFISETHEFSDELVQPLATELRQLGYDVGRIVARMLRSNLFFAPLAYRARIKSPTTYVLGILRGLEANVGTVGVAQLCENLGQKLFYPPSVKGWDGGAAWLNSTTLLLRQNAALALTSTEDVRFGRRCDPDVLAQKHQVPDDDQAQVAFFLNLFLQDDVPTETRQALLDYARTSRTLTYPVYWTEKDRAAHRLRTLCYLVLTQPEMQLE